MLRIFIFALVLSFTTFAAAEVPEEVRTRGKAATVQVTSDKDGQFGSGVVIARGGGHTYILSAGHLVPTAKKVEVKVPGGKTHTAEVLAVSTENDLAVLRLPTVEGMPVPVKLASASVKPASLYSLGWEKGDAPNGLEETLKGKVRLKKPGESNTVLCWEIERKPVAGRSGGPLIDETGRVVGVASGHDRTNGYYVHIETIHAFLRQNGLKWLSEDEKQ